MNSSTELKNLFEALAKAQAEIKPAKRSRQFKGVNNNASYSTIEDLYDAIHPVFTKYGVNIRDYLITNEQGEFALKTIVSHISGEFEESICELLPGKDIRGRITETRKYIIMGITGVCGGEDEEAAADDYVASPKTEVRPKYVKKSEENIAVSPTPTVQTVQHACISQDQLDELYNAIEQLPEVEQEPMVIKLRKRYDINELRFLPKAQYRLIVDHVRDSVDKYKTLKK